MAKVQQYYGAEGAPFTVPGRPEEIAQAWRSHRRRLRGWFEALDDDRWSEPTRCTEWQVTDLGRHLASGSQFLGYTLHESHKGDGTRLLEGFDAQQTAVDAAAMFIGLSPEALIEQITEMDSRVERELDQMAEHWSAPAEAPPGRVPAYVAVNHFLFDSWVHERDLMIPAGEIPITDPSEAIMVASYVVGLTGTQSIGGTAAEPLTLRMHLSDLDRDLRVEVSEGAATVTLEASGGPANVSATAGDLVDFATGRTIKGELAADPAAIDFLSRLATVMA